MNVTSVENGSALVILAKTDKEGFGFAKPL
jgi:hypothetical protein